MNVEFFIYTIETKQELEFFKYILTCQDEHKDKVFVFDVTMPSESLVPKFKYYIFFEDIYYLQEITYTRLKERLSECEKGTYNVILNQDDPRRIYEFTPFVIK